ncbi:aldo/keto reductase [Oceanithermus sp.]
MYRQAGKSGLFTYPLALGTMQFGWTADEATSFAILDRYVEAGGNFIDTADIYSNWAPGNPGGVAERVVGRWLAANPGVRERVLISTKVRGPMGEEGRLGRGSPYQKEGLGRGWILRAAEESLERLNTDWIDIYWMHWVDNRVPIEESLAAMTELVQKGLVRYIGVSNFSAWRTMQALWAADRRGLVAPVALQPHYSIADPVRAHFERELARVAEAYGLGVFPYSPLAGGFLTGKYRPDAPAPDSVRAEGIRRRFFTEKNWRILAALEEVAADHGATPAQVALAWLLTRPYVAAPIVGANTPEQLAGLLPAAELELAPEAVARLDEVSDWERWRTELEI